jgi:hypothetical protein
MDMSYIKLYWSSGWINWRMDEWMNEWMNEWVNEDKTQNYQLDVIFA